MPDIERLTHLAEVLDQVEARKLPFDLREWGQATSCGTAACAIGYAALDPMFRCAGLRLVVEVMDRDGYPQGETCARDIGEFNALAPNIGDAYPVYLGWHGFDAVAAFFGMKMGHVYNLFMLEMYEQRGNYRPTAADVAAKVRAFIAKHAEVVTA